MKHFKLNISRFENEIEMANLVTRVTVDDSGVSSSAKKVANEMNLMSNAMEKAADANDKLAKSSASSRTGIKTIQSDAIRRFNASKNLLQDRMNIKTTSPNTRTQMATMLGNIKTSGLDNLKIAQAGSLNSSDFNKVLSMGGQASKLGNKAAAEEQKYYNKVAKEGLNLLQQQAKEAIKADKAMEKLSNGTKSASNNIKNASKQTSTFSKMIGQLAKAAVRWRILYGAFSRVWNILSDTVNKAAEYEEALNLYTVAMGDYATEGRKWAEKISTALYLDPKTIMQYTGAFYNLVKGLGVGSKAAYTMSTNLTQLTYDMSSYLNIDVESAHDKIQSAMTGQSRAVASAGIAMQQASLQELAYTMGIKTAVSEMTQAEKTYLRYIQIMRSTSNMQGDLARTIVTPENAMRVIRQQFELLGRAIGQVFIPIIMKAIPYVIALTQALTALANRLAASLGFQFAKIDYSSLTTADTAIEDTFNNINDKAAGTAAGVKDSINRTLAAFDELNVVESEAKGGGAGGIGGGSPAANIAALEPYITGYDMLKGLTDELDKQVETARENLEKLGKVLKVVGTVLLTAFALKKLNDLIMFGKTIKDMANAGQGLPGLFKKIGSGIGDFVTWFKIGRESGLNMFDSIRAASDQVLGPIGQFAVAIGGAVAAFASGYAIMRNFDGSMSSLTTNAIGATAAITALTVAAYALTGPIGAVAVAVAGVAGAIIGYNQAKDNLERETEKQIAYAKLFDGVGVSIKSVTDSFQNGVDKILAYNSAIEKAQETLNKTEENTKTASDTFAQLHETIAAGIGDEETIKKLEIATDEFKESVNDNKDANIEYHKTVTGNLVKQGILTKEEYDEINNTIAESYTKRALLESEYADELLKLDRQLQAGTITQEKYNQEVNRLKDAYAGIVTPLNDSTEALSNMYAAASRKIDLEKSPIM